MTIQYEPFIRKKKAKGADDLTMHNAKKAAEIQELDRKQEEIKSHMAEWKARDEKAAKGEPVGRLSFVDYDADPEEGEEDTFPELVGEGYDPDSGEGINLGLGGRSNYSTLNRYMDQVGMDDLLNERDSAIVPEVRRTDFDAGWGPSNTGIGSSYDPRGPGVNSRSYGVPLPYIPNVVKNLQKYEDGANYSEGYQRSFSLALLAAMGLADNAEVKGADWSLLPEYPAALQLATEVKDPEGNIQYRVPYETTKEGEAPKYTYNADGRQIFTNWFNAAMKAHGYDPAERAKQFRVPLTRALLIMQMQNEAMKGNISAERFLKKLKLHTKAGKKAFAKGEAEKNRKEQRAIETLFKYAPVTSAMETITNPTDLEAVLTAALTGSMGDLSLGTSIKRLVTSDLMGSEGTAPVSVKDLGRAASNYNKIRRLVTPIGGAQGASGVGGLPPEEAEKILSIQNNAYLNAIRDKAAYYTAKGEQGNSPILSAYGNRLSRIADAIEQSMGAGALAIDDKDNAFLKKTGLSLSPEVILSQILGSSEAAKMYMKILQLDKGDDNSIVDYFMPRADLARKYGLASEEDVENLPKSQKGLYLRNLVNSLTGELDDIVSGYNTVNKKYAGRTPSLWDMMLYAIHRAPTDNARYHIKDVDENGEEVIKDIWGKKYNKENFSEWDTEDINAIDRKKGQWSWMNDDVQDMLKRLKDTETITDADADLLRTMGFLREGHLLSEYPPEYLLDVFQRYRGSKKMDATEDSIKKNMANAALLAKFDDIITAMRDGDLDSTGVNIDKMEALARSFAQTLASDGSNPILLGKPREMQKSRAQQMKDFVERYLGDDSYREIGLKNFEDKTVDDLKTNKYDIFRFLDGDESSMTRPQTYANNIQYTEKILANEAAIAEKKRKISELKYLRNRRDVDQEDFMDYSRQIKDLEDEIDDLKGDNKKYEPKLTYGDSAVSLDQNNSEVDEDNVTEKSDVIDKKMDTDNENREENDHYLVEKERYNNLLADFDPENVRKNLILALAKDKLMRGAENGANADMDDDTKLLVDRYLRKWPELNREIGSKWLRYNSGEDRLALEPYNLMDEDLYTDDATDDLLGTLGSNAEDIIYSQFPYYRPVDDKELNFARNVLGMPIPEKDRLSLSDRVAQEEAQWERDEKAAEDRAHYAYDWKALPKEWANNGEDQGDMIANAGDLLKNYIGLYYESIDAQKQGKLPEFYEKLRNEFGTDSRKWREFSAMGRAMEMVRLHNKKKMKGWGPVDIDSLDTNFDVKIPPLHVPLAGEKEGFSQKAVDKPLKDKRRADKLALFDEGLTIDKLADLLNDWRINTSTDAYLRRKKVSEEGAKAAEATAIADAFFPDGSGLIPLPTNEGGKGIDKYDITRLDKDQIAHILSRIISSPEFKADNSRRTMRYTKRRKLSEKNAKRNEGKPIEEQAITPRAGDTREDVLFGLNPSSTQEEIDAVATKLADMIARKQGLSDSMTTFKPMVDEEGNPIRDDAGEVRMESTPDVLMSMPTLNMKETSGDYDLSWLNKKQIADAVKLIINNGRAKGLPIIPGMRIDEQSSMEDIEEYAAKLAEMYEASGGVGVPNHQIRIPILDETTGKPTLDETTGSPITHDIDTSTLPVVPNKYGWPVIRVPLLDDKTGEPVIDEATGLPKTLLSQHVRRQKRKDAEVMGPKRTLRERVGYFYRSADFDESEWDIDKKIEDRQA